MTGPVYNNVIRIPTDLKGFFRYWFEFLVPLHGLTSREMDVISSFAYERYELGKVVKDPNILNKVLMSEDTKRKIRDENKMTLSSFHFIMNKLKKNKVIVDNQLNPKYLPNIEEDKGRFKLMLLFEIE